MSSQRYGFTPEKLRQYFFGSFGRNRSHQQRAVLAVQLALGVNVGAVSLGGEVRRDVMAHQMTRLTGAQHAQPVVVVDHEPGTFAPSCDVPKGRKGRSAPWPADHQGR